MELSLSAFNPFLNDLKDYWLWKAGLLWYRIFVTNASNDCHTTNELLRQPTNREKRTDFTVTLKLTIALNIWQLVAACLKYYFSSNLWHDCNSTAPSSSTTLGLICEPFIVEFPIYVDGKAVFSFLFNRSWIWLFRTQCRAKIRNPLFASRSCLPPMVLQA